MQRDDPAPDGAVPAADPQLQDLVTALLTGAIQTSYTLDRLRTLAQLHHGDDPIALAQINDALDMLSTTKAALIQNADIAAALPPPP